jgi:hypothetical protein
MLSAVVGTSFILSVGMLMAHAVDAFRNRMLRNLSDSVATLPWAGVSEFPLVRNASNL